ncbi:Inner membrane protein YjcH [Methylobacterium crusticola]|uniref:Inner membrane protein YjcH n=2 Tax=Methylobacterium crusticola TaxID=1697972 RepID=A0ABQ4R2U5_9HYPH|nr:Inner membrane protein YjcH [Methylobacterium crusticola]
MGIDRIEGHPVFRRLAFERRCLGLALAAAMSAAYFGYILTVAFRPALLGTPVRDGSVITWGIVAGAGLLSFGFVLTALYVLVANTRLDALSRRLREDLR